MTKRQFHPRKKHRSYRKAKKFHNTHKVIEKKSKTPISISRSSLPKKKVSRWNKIYTDVIKTIKTAPKWLWLMVTFLIALPILALGAIKVIDLTKDPIRIVLPSLVERTKPVQKSPEAKQAVIDAELEQMSSYGLYYDYANLSLVETVQAFLAEYDIDPSQVAFSYKNLVTKEVFSMNENQSMLAGSTYKLPLNMLVVDAIKEGKVSATEQYDITQTTFESESERDAYVSNYNGLMTIADMQYGSIVVSENTPAYALADRIGGMGKAYDQFDRYGKSKTAAFPAFQPDANRTTTSYYIELLEYLYDNQEEYKDLMHFLDEAFPGEWYEELNSGVTVYQKPGYSREALNVDAIVMEETPYIIALYTAGLGGASEKDVTINVDGYNLVTMLTYVINEWHRVNMNPEVQPVVEESTTESIPIVE